MMVYPMTKKGIVLRRRDVGNVFRCDLRSKNRGRNVGAVTRGRERERDRDRDRERG
jgi:hypothetical protein